MKESSRQERIIRTSLIGILVNLLIAAVKIVIGTLASSIAIVSEGINNATDAGSSFLTYVGTKLSGKHPDEKHPFGYGRIEYLTGLVANRADGDYMRVTIDSGNNREICFFFLFSFV